MGKMNLLKANWTGRVGQTVGAKWKNISTIRSYTKPTDADTPAQQTIRSGFGDISKFISLFAPQVKSLSPLNVKGMSVRNAILQINKDMIVSGALAPATLTISKGGLTNVAGITATVPAGLASLNVSWTPSVSVIISAKAKVVVVAVDSVNSYAIAGSGLQSAGTLSIPAAFKPNAALAVYVYLLDYRGSSKVGSISAYQSVTAPAA